MLSILYWIYCLAFALDFRGEEGGSSAHYIFLLAAVASGGLIVYIGRKKLFILPSAYLLILWAAFLFMTPIVAASQGVSLGNHIRCTLPLYLMGLSLLVMQVMAGFGTEPHRLIIPLAISGSVNIAWRAAYALGVKGIPISEIRYELLSSAAPMFIAYALVAFFFSQRKLPWDVLLAGG
ncbi:MAG: hypothetical protein ACI957_002395, partial [Verrucomicrobiales bacterium]